MAGQLRTNKHSPENLKHTRLNLKQHIYYLAKKPQQNEYEKSVIAFISTMISSSLGLLEHDVTTSKKADWKVIFCQQSYHPNFAPWRIVEASTKGGITLCDLGSHPSYHMTLYLWRVSHRYWLSLLSLVPAPKCLVVNSKSFCFLFSNFFSCTEKLFCSCFQKAVW